VHVDAKGNVGNAIDGSLKAFIPDPADLDKVIAGTSASGIAADGMGSVFAADVGAHNLRKYVKVKSQETTASAIARAIQVKFCFSFSRQT
jgi:hypothetical protein